MLILRRELKVGLGVGAAMLGVAAVYGAMSLLTGGSQSTPLMKNSDTPSDTLQLDGSNNNGNGLDVAIGGLPPPEPAPGIAQTGQTGGTQVATGNTPPSDPFAESARKDGADANADRWTIAFKTGRVTDVTPALGHSNDLAGPVRTQNPGGGNGATEIGNPLGSGGSVAGGGNSRGSSESSDTAATERRQSTAAGGKYVVQSGDTFSSIAGKLYGNRNLYHVITKANPNVDPARLKPGTEIVVPAADTVKTDRTDRSERGAISVQREPAITGAIDANKQYRVQAGDTLHKISLRLYGKTNQWAAIYDLNKAVIGPDAGKLKVGTVLTLPQVPTQH